MTIMQDGFQNKVREWVVRCFGGPIANDRKERSHRFLEESLELCQAVGCTKEEAEQLVDYVFSRPTGEVKQEIGGAMVTLAALCAATGWSMTRCGEIELERVQNKIEAIRAKRATKPMASALPGEYAGEMTRPGDTLHDL